MTTIRPFDVMDLLKFNNVNLDINTETYGFNYYLYYLVNHSEFFQVAEHPNGEIMGYTEGMDENWHSHVSALSVAPSYRRMGLAASMMGYLENMGEQKSTYFVDLFVRLSNKSAIELYKSLGYIIYRQVLDYYSGERDEDAYDMRKSLSRDPKKIAMVPLAHPVHCRDMS